MNSSFIKKWYVTLYKMYLRVGRENFLRNHNYNKIVKSDWLSTALISALIGQSVRVMPK